MRISGGEWCGRKLKVPAGDAVRPTQDRVREALFSMLMQCVPESRFLDLFAGSGAVGLEALSRGARDTTWVEQSAKHVAILKENKALLAPELGEIVCADALRWIRGPGCGRRYDIVFADPPYEWAREQGLMELMTALCAGNVIAERGFFVAETAENTPAEEIAGWTLLRDRTYGHTRLALYRRNAEQNKVE